MKLANLLTILLLIFTTTFVSAQSLKTFKKEMKNISSALSLDENQNDELTKIYEKRVEDLKSIKSLEATNEPNFREKRRAIYQGAEVSIKRMLNREQLELFVLYNRGIREKRGREMNKLKKKNASIEDLKDAQFGVL